MPIQVGDSLPNVTFRVSTSDGPVPKTTDEVFKGKRVVLFAVPGAFTPTCHKNHLPGYVSRAEEIKAKNIDTIAVVSVNDPFVMGAWEQASGADGKVLFLSDGNGDFAKALDLFFDGSAVGLGLRSKRYSMLVEDGVVKVLNVEDVPSKADASSAQALLAQI
ncbi:MULTISPECIES: peroxiredoxin [Azorhizobium]|uniref:Glutathione-dependent peroxiredoxin n=1 Tax=Azorhizobium caulinodans (strain ATCC 43989 / DSM 5975 / JCM 20966 / LMG 6465 / NBRC 14845 / NCIMB 13405 / ORS 571) TaxID=438753 RepID=A8IM48_AZOC5|nr:MULTISPECIES: peroxiredoxin [Azorhizobium]TDT96500.1 peroxiredoxin [Azorhizobium sp. AG788]BAF86484.1 alkyl hydroperoxide reductase [Azorhizobium caulinodans ORS 571]